MPIENWSVYPYSYHRAEPHLISVDNLTNPFVILLFFLFIILVILLFLKMNLDEVVYHTKVRHIQFKVCLVTRPNHLLHINTTRVGIIIGFSSMF